MGLYLKGRFNGRFFALSDWGAYIWRGLFSEFYGILPRCFKTARVMPSEEENVRTFSSLTTNISVCCKTNSLRELVLLSVQASDDVVLRALNTQRSCNANLVPLRTNSSDRSGFSAGTLKIQNIYTAFIAMLHAF